MTLPRQGGDALAVSGGGVTSVVSAELLQHRALLHGAAGEFTSCARRLDAINAPIPGAGTVFDSSQVFRAEQAIDEAVRRLRAAGDQAGLVATALGWAVEGYSASELMLERSAQGIAAQIGHSLGFVGSTVGMVLLPGLVGSLALGAGVLAVSAMLDPRGTADTAARAKAWLEARKELLSDPRFVQLVRLSAMSADDFGLGLMHLPEPWRWLLGDEGWGILGLDTSAATGILIGGVFGALAETPVIVRAQRSQITAPATSWADRAGRIPTGSAQVRVDRYLMPGQPDRFEVFIGGTVDFSAKATGEPWDMTSNVSSVAGRQSGAYLAVTAALAEAGVTSDSPLVANGYSQGGLIAARLAASEDYNVRGLFTLGAPAGQVPVPAEVAWVALEHTDDLVPAVGGTFASSAAIVARRRAVRNGKSNETLALPAHQLSRYRESSALADATEDQRLQKAAKDFAAFGARAEWVESTWYHAKRDAATRDAA
ncbi:MAG: hypothetical protein H7248_10280, partial [Microbacteriaceae bacterium]|nr:hypothetical protein [Microbacteriaceae bacterium]